MFDIGGSELLVIGVVVEMTALRTLYPRDHLDQVLATFGLILFFNEATRLIWGPEGLVVPLPAFLESSKAGSIKLGAEICHGMIRGGRSLKILHQACVQFLLAHRYAVKQCRLVAW